MKNHSQQIADGLQIIRALGGEENPPIDLKDGIITCGSHAQKCWPDMATVDRLYHLGWFVDHETDLWTYQHE